MAKKSMPQLTEEEMIQVIEDFKNSGLTRKEFCKGRDYPMSNFYYWQKKYFEKFPEQLDTGKPRRGRKPKSVVEGEAGAEGAVKAAKSKAKSSKGKVSAKKQQTKKTVKKVKKAADVVSGASAEPKRPGRPRKVVPVAVIDDLAPVIAEQTDQTKAPKVPKAVKAPKVPKAPKAPKAPRAVKAPKVPKEKPAAVTKPSTAISEPVIQIRYPNGIRINVSGDIDIKRLKELMTL
jgi:hypothetical protein